MYIKIILLPLIRIIMMKSLFMEKAHSKTEYGRNGYKLRGISTGAGFGFALYI